MEDFDVGVLPIHTLVDMTLKSEEDIKDNNQVLTSFNLS